MQFHFHLKRYQIAETYLYAAAEDRQFNGSEVINLTSDCSAGVSCLIVCAVVAALLLYFVFFASFVAAAAPTCC